MHTLDTILCEGCTPIRTGRGKFSDALPVKSITWQLILGLDVDLEAAELNIAGQLGRKRWIHLQSVLFSGKFR